MIVTHTQNAAGQQRIYLGGKGSLECWIDPNADRRSWTFHVEEAVAGNQLTDADKRAWAIHILCQLAVALNVAHDDLKAVPFEAIAALHTSDPFAGRRIAVPRRKTIEQGYMATLPNISRPQADYAVSDESSRSTNHRSI